MKILVTGGSGTIGGYVIRELLQGGHTVTNYSRTPPATKGIESIEGDIMNPEQMKAACAGHDAVVHLAAVPGPGRATPDQMIHVNVSGTVNALEAALASGIPKFVFASSGAATGFCFQTREVVPSYLPLDEEHASRPQDLYGLSKLLAEQACRRYSDAFGMSTICLRISNNWYLDREEAGMLLGRGWAKDMTTVEQLWQARYYKTIREPDSDWPVPGPPSPKNILWVVTDARDAAQAFRLAVENQDVAHDVLLINGDDTCSTEKTQDLLEKHLPNVPLKKQFDGFDTLVSHNKATRVLGFRPRYTWRRSDFSQWLEAC